MGGMTRPKFLLDPNRSFGRPNMGDDPNYLTPEFDLLVVADVVFHHLATCDEKVLRTIKFIKIGFNQANNGMVRLHVNGEFEEAFKAPREVHFDIALSNDEQERSEALAGVQRRFCRDQQKVIREMIEGAELAEFALKEHLLTPA